MVTILCPQFYPKTQSQQENALRHALINYQMELRKEKDINLITDITLGLVDTLTSVSGIRDVSVGLRQGTEKANLAAWEQRHGVVLPSALKQLYLTSDGFSLTWNFTVAGKVLPLGNLELHPLTRLNRVGSGRSSGDPLSPSLADLAMAEEVLPSSVVVAPCPATSMQDNLGLGSVQIDTSNVARKKIRSWAAPTFHVSKLFEIDSCKGNGRVVLAYPGRGETFPEASFWFIDLSLRPHLLATESTVYWRLLLVYLGMPQWQSLASGLGLTPWARQWYEILAPHLVEGCFRQHRSSQPEIINKLDWSVFKTKKNNKTKNAKDCQKDLGKNSKEVPMESAKINKETQRSGRNSKEIAKESTKTN